MFKIAQKISDFCRLDHVKKWRIAWNRKKKQLYFLRFHIARMQNKHSRPFSKEWHESLYAIQRFMRAYQWQTFSEWMRRSDRLLNRQKSQQSCKPKHLM